MPLVVIREYLADVDAGRDPAPPTAMPPSIVPAPRRYRREELLAASGAAPQLLNDAISTGVLTAADGYNDQAVAILRALVAAWIGTASNRAMSAPSARARERDVALVESALAAAEADGCGIPGPCERACARARQAPGRGARDLRPRGPGPHAVLTPEARPIRDTPGPQTRMSLPGGRAPSQR